MSQSFDLPSGTNVGLSTALVTKLPDACRALRSRFSGSSEPSSTVAFQEWVDDAATAVVKQRNAANSAWVGVHAAAEPIVHVAHVAMLAVSATVSVYLIVLPQAGNVRKLRVVTDTTTSGSDGSNEWRFALQNLTQAEALFSGTVGTSSSTGGVGGGAELTADVPMVLTPDQNALCAAGDVIELTVTKTGSPTSPLARLDAFLEYDAVPV